MKNKQPQKCNIVRDLHGQLNTHRDADLEKLLIEVDMKIKSLKYTCVRFGNNCTLRFEGTFQRSSSYVNKILSCSISQIRNVAAALEPLGFKCGSVEMWKFSMFLSTINHVFGTLVIRRIDENFFLQVAELNVVLALVLSPVFHGAASHLRIGDGTGCSKDRALEKFVNLDILKSLERTLGSLGSVDTLNTDNFEVVFIHVFHDIVQMVQELIEVIAPFGLGVGSLSCIKHRMDCGKDRVLENFVNLDILKSLVTLGSLGSVDALNNDNFEVVDIHVFHDIVQMVQELIEVMALDYVYYFSPSCIEDRVACGKDRGLIGFTNYGLLKNSENGTRLLGPAATKINDDGFVLGINNLDKNFLGNNVAAEAENGNSIEDCMNEKYPSNATNDSRKDGRTEEDDVLNDCSRLKGKF